MACLPRFDVTGEDGAIVPFADAVRQLDVDLAPAMLQAEARRSSKKLEQIVSQLRRLDS